MTACAGAICEAERRSADRAILLIHEFWTNRSVDKRHEANAKDLNNFVSRLSQGALKYVEPGHLYGPFLLPGSPLFSQQTQFFIGKAIRNVREASA
jgi:hypothetical protein